MYIPLLNKTTYTFLSSLLEVDDLIEIAKENNLDSISICDDFMYGTMEFITKCNLNNINPIVGLDLTNRLLFAKNYNGYKNLLKLATIKTKRELTNDDYFKYKDNLICIPLTKIDLIYEDVFYPLNNENKDKENVIYLNKLLYKNEDDYETLKYLELLRDNLTIVSDYLEKKNCYYQKDINTSKIALENTFKLSKLCNLELPEFKLNLPKYDETINSNEYLTSLSFKGLMKRFNNNPSNEYLYRLKYELDIIIKMGFSDYFLVVYDFIKFAKNKNILVGPGRGSAASSLVSYTLGITDIDPIKYDLLFERFLNPERITMPDIDTDFPDIYRDLVIDYVKEKYGEKHVSSIVTFGTMGSKMCIRDIGRVLNISLPVIDNISKLIGAKKDKLIDIIKNDPRLKDLIKSDNKIKKLMEIAIKVEGIKRHTSTHAAGIIISSQELDEVLPLVYDENLYISGYEASYLENLGLLKMDFLGIKNLTTIMEIIETVKKEKGIDINFKDIPLDDLKTIELFKQGNTSGIFQFESIGMKNFLKELKPRDFIDLSNAIALFRPGPASSIPSFIKRKEGLEEVNYFTKELESVLKSTYGIIVYQEQIMQIARIIAGYTYGEADILRRAMSKKKKEVLLIEEEKFIKKAILNGYKEELAKTIYDLILKFASYGFNKSHSIAYTMISYKMAYLKVYYKEYFYVSLLNSVISDIDKTKEYMYELKKYNLNIEKPNINLSSCSYLVNNNKIIAPFNIIKGISKIICNKIIEERKDGYKDIYDFFSSNGNLTKNNIEILIQAGCLDSFNYTRKTLIENLEVLMNYSSLCKDLEKEYVLLPEIINYPEYDNLELIEMEKELYGFYITNHPVLNYKLKDNNIVNLTDIEKYFNKKVNLIVMVEKIRVIETKHDAKMMFFKASDEEALGEFTMFPPEYNKYYNLKKGDIIKVNGRIEKRNGSYQIIVSYLNKLN